MGFEEKRNVTMFRIIKGALIITLLFAFGTCFAKCANASSYTMPCYWCKGVLVSVGCRKGMVLDKCGEPVAMDSTGHTVNKNSRKRYTVRETEEWVYGPKAGWYAVLTFEGGKLVEIRHQRD